jgi:hypothetical protein
MFREISEAWNCPANPNRLERFERSIAVEPFDKTQGRLLECLERFLFLQLPDAYLP